MKHVTKSEFKAHALDYFRQVETSGESLVVTDRGQPTVEVRRYRADQRPPLGTLKDSVVALNDPFAPVSGDAWDALT